MSEWDAFPAIGHIAPSDVPKGIPHIVVSASKPSGDSTSASADWSAFPEATAQPSDQTQPPVQAPQSAGPNVASTLPGPLGSFQNFNNAFQTGAAQGMTLGFGDELAAGAMTPIQMGIDAFQGKGFDPGASYNRALQGGRQDMQAQQDLNPTAAFAGNLTGNMVTGGAANKLGLTFLKGPVKGILPMIGKGMAEGASYGAITGFGSGDSLGDRVDKTITGNVIGGAIGAPLGALGAWLGARGAAKGPPSSGLSPEADQVLSEAMAQQGGPQAPRPGSMVADQGPITRDLLDVAAQRAGPSAYIARQAVEQRASAANSMVNTMLDRTLGKPQALDALTQATRDNTAAARDATYRAAYSKPIDYTSKAGQDIQDLLHRVPQSAINRANSLLQVEGNRSIRPIVYKDGSRTIADPTVQQIDLITRALNDEAKNGEGAGKMGGLNDIGRAMKGLAYELRGATKRAVPAYQVALETAATPIQRNEALQFGSEILNSSTSRNDVHDFVANSSRPEIAAAKEGLRSQYDEILANVRQMVSDPNVDARQVKALVDATSSPAAREKVATLLGPRDSKNLFSAMDQAFKALSLRSAINAGSRTFIRTQAENAVKNRLNNTVMGDILDLKPIQAPRRAMQVVTGRSPAAMQSKEAKYWADLANALTASGSEQDRLLNSIGIKRSGYGYSLGSALLAGPAQLPNSNRPH